MMDRRNLKLRVFKSFEEADAAEREESWAMSPAERLRACEVLRQLNYGYGKGQPLPYLQRILKVVELPRG
jgi:hypothetical protein